METKTNTVDVIIPTYDNIQQLQECVRSINRAQRHQPVNIIIVNNGKIPVQQYIDKSAVTIIDAGENLGWTGGLQLGLDHSTSEYVVFANDDIFIPTSEFNWLQTLLKPMKASARVAAVGPISNCVMGAQNQWVDMAYGFYAVPFLIGFCMAVRRSALDDIGGVDTAFYTGDDIDLSIRFWDKGYSMVVHRGVFIYHHGFQTGQKIHGGPDKPGGWNSAKMSNDTNKHLIQKHGFKKWWRTMVRSDIGVDDEVQDSEGIMVKSYVNGHEPKTILEIGCGGKKTIPGSVGLDIIPHGQEIPYVTGVLSVADITADTDKKLPCKDNSYHMVIARHVLEHCLDTIEVLKEWKRVVKPGGRIVIACPDERLDDSIQLNPQHVHAFTPDTIAHLAGAIGLKAVETSEYYNQQSFTICLEKAV